MSEYTPTTEDIRNYWIAQGIKRSSKRDRRAADFDRWLAEVKADAWEDGKEYGDKRANREIPFQSNPYLEETE